MADIKDIRGMTNEELRYALADINALLDERKRAAWTKLKGEILSYVKNYGSITVYSESGGATIYPRATFEKPGVISS